jgi:hypothetical protein
MVSLSVTPALESAVENCSRCSRDSLSDKSTYICVLQAYAFSNPIMPGASLGITPSHQCECCMVSARMASLCVRVLQRYTPSPGPP